MTPGTSDNDHLINSDDVAVVLGLAHRNSVSGYQKRYDDMPRPAMDPGPGRPKLWRRSEIENWAARRGQTKVGRGPLRDAFYSGILTALDGELDSRLFEQCAADLLHPELPVVPIKGGDDLGMDGAVFDGGGASYPLVTTIDKDGIGNLTRNLTRYRETGGTRRSAAFATSRVLSARQRRNLERKAKLLGFTLVQIIDRHGMADRLYRSPRWCKELLGITGEPPALSMIPLSSRPLHSVRLIGRNEEAKSLRTSREDQIVAGPPGSGKTALLVGYARDGYGGFVTTSDRIAEGIRQQDPAAVIVDDAHVQLGLLDSLVQIRRELRARFRIIASTWPGDRHHVATRLGLSDSQIISLDRLTRNEVAEVVHEAGLDGPTKLIREIVDQAEGLPGLAVTLAMICLRDGSKDVVLGNAVSSDIRSTLEPLLGRRATQILATLGVGGDTGVCLRDAADSLGLPIADVHADVVELAAAGVVHKSPTRHLVVRPRALRHALVRDIFFGEAPGLPVEPILDRASRQEAAMTLAEVAAIGGGVPLDLLVGELRIANSDRAWANWARSNETAAERAMREFPRSVLTHPRPFLHRLPDKALDILLSAAQDDHRELGQNPDHPLRLVADWIGSSDPGQGHAVSRRRKLTGAAIRWAAINGPSDLPGRAFALAISPAFENTSTDPGIGMTMTRTYGLLPPHDIKGIGDLWSEEIRPWLATLPAEAQIPVVNALRNWVHPDVAGLEIGPELRQSMTTQAKKMLSDLFEIAAGRLGLQLKIANLATSVGLQLDEVEYDYSLLYGNLDVQDWKASTSNRLIELESLADEIHASDPAAIAGRLSDYERMREEAEHTWPRFVPEFAEMLAARSVDPEKWVQVLVRERLAPDVLNPFLARSLDSQPSAVWELLSDLIEDETYAWLAISLGLTRPDAPDHFVARADKVDSESLRLAASRGELCEPGVSRLLKHSDVGTASAVAIGLWLKSKSPPDQPDLEGLWRQAIVRTPNSEYTIGYWLGQILKEDAGLAYEWLWRRLGLAPPPPLIGIGPNPMDDALAVLDEDARISLLQRLQPTWEGQFIVAPLVRDYINVYRVLLDDERLKSLHLEPLVRRPDDSWRAMAQVALERGYAPSDVAKAAFTGFLSWSGDESAMWGTWKQAFSDISAGADEQMEQVVEKGIELASLRADSASRQERERSVYGID